MNRREALKSVALMMGGTIIGAQAFLSSCQSNEDSQEILSENFSDKDIAVLNEIAETIIPATDTPGAKAANVGGIMAVLVLDCYDQKNQKAFKEGLSELQGGFIDMFGHSFMEGSAEERHQYLTKLNEELVPMNNQIKKSESEHYFRMMKELTLLGYFTSEIGATQALRYVETPGRYDGCMPYEKGDKAWAV